MSPCLGRGRRVLGDQFDLTQAKLVYAKLAFFDVEIHNVIRRIQSVLKLHLPRYKWRQPHDLFPRVNVFQERSHGEAQAAHVIR